MTKDLRNKPEFNPLMRASLDACVKCTICETQCPVAAVTPLFPGPKYVGPQAALAAGLFTPRFCFSALAYVGASALLKGRLTTEAG